MPCKPFTMPGGGGGFICTSGREKRARCSVCGTRWSTRLCDGDVGDGKTCDAPLCMDCTVQSAPVETLERDTAVRALQQRQAMLNRTPTKRKNGEMQQPIPYRPAPDPRDFCPKHVPAPSPERQKTETGR